MESTTTGTEITTTTERALTRSKRAERVRETAQRSQSERTLREYKRACQTFADWCEREGRVARDPDPEAAADTVSEYLRDRADQGRKRATVEQDLAAIAFAYQDAGLPSPSRHPGLRKFMRGLRREYAQKGAQAAQVAAVTDTDLRAMLATLPDTLMGKRDRAMLLLGWIAALRRSEIVALDVADVADDRNGLLVTVRRSKTDQLGSGMLKAIPYAPTADLCPVRSLRAWLDGAGITSGPVFRAVDRHGNVKPNRTDGLTVARVVKRCAEASGIDARVGGHSLRAGFITTAALKGCSERAIANQTGHKSVPVLRAYVRRAQAFDDNAATSVVNLGK